MRPGDVDLEALRANNAIEDVIGRYLDLKKRGSEWVGLCPFHSERTPSLYVVPNKGFYHCYGCGAHGDVFDFIAEFEGLKTPRGHPDMRAVAEKLGHLPTDRPPLPPSPPDDSGSWHPILPAPDDAPAYNPGKTWNPRSVDPRTGTAGRYVDWNRSRTRLDTYRAAGGSILGHVVRLEFDGQKMPMVVTFCRHAETGEQRWCAVKFPSPRPLQGLDELAARPGAKVLVVSGEKCKEAGACGLPGFVTVTWPGGDQNAGRADWSPLYGRAVTFWHDLDRQRDDAGVLMPFERQSGFKAMAAVADELVRHGGAVRMLDLRAEFDAGTYAGGWDVADATADGWGTPQLVEFCRARVRDWPWAKPAAAGAGSDEDAGVTPRDTDDREAANGPAPAERNTNPRDATAHALAADDGPPVPRAGFDRDDEYARLTAALDEARNERRDRAVRDFLSAPAEPVFFEDVELDREDLAPAAVLAGDAPPRARITGDLDTTVNPLEDDLPAKYSEDNVALLLADGVRDQFRYVPGWGRWMWWEENRWVYDERLRAFDASRRFCRFAATAARADGGLTPSQQAAVAKTYGLASTVSAVARLAQSDQRLSATTEQWDADLWALNTPGGIVDLQTGRLRAPGRSDYMTKITRVAPTATGCPTWTRFLETATGGDVELQAFLRRVAGYCLTGSVRDQALFFVYGTGGNGKGTFLNTLTWILNDYSAVAGIETFTESKHDRHTTELARLRGARFVTAQEVEEGKRWAEAKIKALTGGDPITARFMRQDDFTFLPQFKLVIAGNHKPGLRNVDEAIKRRLHLIPFTVTITKENRDERLSEKLQAEAGGILQWAIDGCVEWARVGLRPPGAVVAATAEYLDQQDTLGAWLHERCRFGPDLRGASSALYGSFRRWAEKSGEYVLPQKRWLAAMESRGLVFVRDKRGSGFLGVDVVFDAERDTPSYGDDPDHSDRPPPDLWDEFNETGARQ